MKNYIDAEKLKVEIEKRRANIKAYCLQPNHDKRFDVVPEQLSYILSDISSLQQEQPEVAYIFKPNMTIDEMIDSINGKKPEVDLEAEIDKVWNNGLSDELSGPHNNFDICARLARHFYKLGLNARKEEYNMIPNYDKLALGHTLAEVDNGMPNGISDCWAYGMVGGCDEYCPVLLAGKCELQDTDNAELYQKAIAGE